MVSKYIVIVFSFFYALSVSAYLKNVIECHSDDTGSGDSFCKKIFPGQKYGDFHFKESKCVNVKYWVGLEIKTKHVCGYHHTYNFPLNLANSNNDKIKQLDSSKRTYQCVKENCDEGKCVVKNILNFKGVNYSLCQD